jgi:hypothetical protein
LDDAINSHLEEIAAQIFLVLYLEDDLLSLGRDSSSRLDLVVSVTTMVAIR